MEQGPGSAVSNGETGDHTEARRGRSRRSDSGDIRLALRWYFLGEGKGGRIAACACHVSLLTLLGTVLLTVLTMGSMVLGTVFTLHAESPIARHVAKAALNDATALQFVSTVDALLRGGFASDVVIALTLSLCFEFYWTVRRAPRIMPPAEFVEYPSRKGVPVA
jgi:hypothetical protein